MAILKCDFNKETLICAFTHKVNVGEEKSDGKVVSEGWG